MKWGLEHAPVNEELEGEGRGGGEGVALEEARTVGLIREASHGTISDMRLRVDCVRAWHEKDDSLPMSDFRLGVRVPKGRGGRGADRRLTPWLSPPQSRRHGSLLSRDVAAD